MSAAAAFAPMPTRACRLPPRVRPAMHAQLQRFLDDTALVFSLLDGLGSPLNIVFPDRVAETIAGFQRVYAERSLRGTVFMTHKPNRSQALVRRAAVSTAGLDVSSEGELAAGLRAGFSGARIEATGPKDDGYLALCVQQGVLVNVDSMGELHRLLALHAALGRPRPIRVSVRLDGFTSTRVRFNRQDGSFGIPAAEAGAVLDLLLQHRQALDFQGFAFHFMAGETDRRIPAIETCLELTFEAMRRGLAPRGLNIGGGFRISLAADRDEWNCYRDALKESVLGQRPSLTWNDSGLGLRNDNGRIAGAPNFMEHWQGLAGADELAALLDTPLPAFDGLSCAQILCDNLLELYVEPGRAMLAGAGLTLARVMGSKRSMHGERLVQLEMNRTNINAAQLKLMTDPVLLHRGTAPYESGDEGVYYLGNLCLATDLIQYHKTFPQHLPQPGDAAAFIDTAAYRMDFAETAVLQQRTAMKLAVVERDGALRWFRDDLYNPLAQALAGAEAYS